MNLVRTRTEFPSISWRLFALLCSLALISRADAQTNIFPGAVGNRFEKNVEAYDFAERLVLPYIPVEKRWGVKVLSG